MTHTTPQGTVDPLDFSEVLARDAVDGPKVTITIPSDPTGARAELAPIALKNQLRAAEARLVAGGVGSADAQSMLSSAAELVEDSSYWRMQSRGLVLFAADGFHLAARIPIEVPESLAVGDHFNLLPLAPVLASDRKIYVLALSRGLVRLFDSTRNTITPLPLENIPASFDEVVDELPEKHTDVRSTGAVGDAPHAQGMEDDPDRMLLEKFIRAVGRAVGQRLGTARSQPLVLAAVAEYLPIFMRECPYPAVFDGVVPGNPEHTQIEELRSAAWRLILDSEQAHEDEERDRAHSLAHHGKGAFDLAEIARAAESGRVDTLFLPRDGDRIGTAESRALANQALIDTLRTSGALRTLATIDGEALATFRY